jgi:hypothetical protein
MTIKQVETSNAKLFGRLVDRLASDYSLEFADAVKAVLSTPTWRQVMNLEEPVYYMDETDQYAVIVREWKESSAPCAL